MTTAIWKFPLRKMGARIVLAAEQHGILCVWALVDVDGPGRDRTIYIVGTGVPTPPFGRHVGSAVCDGGAYVWHVFERGA